MPVNTIWTFKRCSVTGKKTVHTELIPILVRGTAFEVLGNNTEPDHEIRKRRENATKAFAGLI